MNKFLAGVLAVGLLMPTLLARGNDSGIYTVQPFGAQADLSAKSFTLTGQYAKELQKLLPPGFSVVTNMQPELKNAYEKNFRGIIMRDPSGKALIINCSSAELGYSNGKSSINPKAESSCNLQIQDKASADEIASDKLQVKDALAKASAANRLP